MIGFIGAEELTHVGRKSVRVAVPLFEFNYEVMMNKCGYESSWIKSKGIDLMSDETPVLDECGRRSFVVVELELEKPLNEEVYENSREDHTAGVNALVSGHKITNLGENLRAFARNLLTGELNPSQALLRAISNGKLAQIKKQLLPSVSALAREFIEPNEKFEEFKVNFQCKLTSKLMNEQENKLSITNDQRKQLQAKFYQALGMEAEACEIFLQEITKNIDSEVAWLNCGVHFMRRQCYEKAAVCIDEVLRVNEISFIGAILKEFLDLKTGKVNECKKIENFMKNSPEALDDFVSDSELLWYSEKDDDLLSCHDNLVKFAILFIKLGCFDVAEECIGEYYSLHGANVNYFYLLASIDALRGEHSNALIHLNKIADNDVGNHNVNVSHFERKKF